MKKITRKHLILGIMALVITISGCSHVISKESRNMAVKNIPFQWIAENPARYQGILVIWGGEIIETKNTQEGTIIEILQRPLGYSEEPDETQGSGGRFLVLYDTGYLDPALFQKGTKITVAGMVEGEKRIRLGEIEYPYPYLIDREIHVWNDGLMLDQYQSPYLMYPRN